MAGHLCIHIFFFHTAFLEDKAEKKCQHKGNGKFREGYTEVIVAPGADKECQPGGNHQKCSVPAERINENAGYG